ncbi:MAG: sulfite exporter TauE/SafE family protein [Deltaproteobacteria bacterium]|nr:sulfite exporter TauE/SafE family protein [Deltaproteobacteria bacterium]
MFDLLAPLAVGFVGSLHCLGMCGPLVMAYSLSISSFRNQGPMPSLWQKGLLHHGAFHLGRLLTYGLLGAIAAGFAHVVNLQMFLSGLRGNISFLGGIMMVGFGLILLKVLPWPSLSLGSGSFFRRVFTPLLQSQRLISKVALGLATGFLPCLLSWAMMVKAATAENPWGGFSTMVFFGLGTVPVLFVTGLSTSLLSLQTRLIGERVAALSVVVMGLILIFKGARSFV